MEELNNNNVTADEIIDYNEETGEIYDLAETDDNETTEGGTTNKLAVAGIIAGVIAGGVAVYKNRKKIAKKWRDKRRASMEKILAKYDELDAAYALETTKDKEDDFDDDFFREDPEIEGNNTETVTETQQSEKENPTPKKGK